MTFELLRPVPMAPIELRARTLRPGKKVQLVEASVVADGTEVVRATALRIRRADVEFADPPEDRLTPGPSEQLRERFAMTPRRTLGTRQPARLAAPIPDT